MATRLFYNNKQVLSGQPTPLVSREDSMVLYGERWAEQVHITLNGQITGCPLAFWGLISAQQSLLDIFSKDFQSFSIEDGGATIYNLPYVQVQSVRFPTSNYVGIVNYEVSLQAYPSDLFSGFYGVLDPEDSWDFEETEDSRLRVTRTVSARGFNTSSGFSNALNNARNFIATRTGSSGIIPRPYFINLPSGWFPCLKSVKQDINEFTASYKISSTYESDLYYNSGEVLRYTTKFDCSNIEGISKVSVEGEIDGCLSSSIYDLRRRYSGFNVYGAALEAYQNATSRTDLNTYFLKSGVVEEAQQPKLSFQADFDNYTGANVSFNYTANVNSGENDLISVSVDGTINARGSIAAKWTAVNNYYQNSVNLYGIATDAYNSFVGSYPISLNPTIVTSGATFNQFVAEIRTNASWDNRVSPVSGFSSLTYTLDFVPSLEKVIAKPLATDINGPICGNEYYVVDLGYKNRSSFTMNGNGKMDCSIGLDTSISNLKTFANQQFITYCPTTRAVLEKYTIATGSDSISFDFSWSAESPNNLVASPSNYTNINNLSLK